MHLANNMIYLQLARSKIGSYVLPWIFTHLSFLLPVKREYEHEDFLAFHHPKPGFPVHILLVPKIPIRGINELTAKDSELLFEIMKAAQIIVNRFDPAECSYRLILNAGAYQDVPHLHFHLISEEITNEQRASE